MKPEEFRAALSEHYAKLSVEEKRRRIVLEPAFRDAYNEITEAHRQVPVPHYFWAKWVPTLGPVASMLYMRLRQYCYHNPETGEERNECWPKQATLASEIGVKDRKTIRRALVLLEEHGFIKRKSTYRLDEKGRPHQGSDHYLVYFEVPLVTEDAVELLIRRTEPDAKEGGAYEGKKSPHRTWTVDKSPYEGKISPHVGGEKIPSRSITRTSTPNVTNVDSRTSKEKTGKATLRDDPRVRAMPEAEKAQRESLTYEVSDQLKVMAGDRDVEPHKSLGFIRRVCFLMPEQHVREALISTRDAIEEQRSGRKSLREGPAGYFAGIVRAIEHREGLDLGVKWGGKARPSPERAARAPERPRERRGGGEEPHREDSLVPMSQATREALRSFLGEPGD